MGDRGNIALSFTKYGTDKKTKIYFYTHWSGRELPSTLADALDSKIARRRWRDDSYLARIIFDRLTIGHQGDETGFGISPWIGDNSHPVLYVDLSNRTVHIGEKGQARSYEAFIRAVRNKELGKEWE